MAEALSVAASGIAVFQVATQVGQSIIKLKQFWDELQDAPSSIRDLLDQIECLDPALWEADHTFNHTSLPPMFWDNSIASRSTAYCHKALSSLTEVVDELALQVNRPGKLRRKVASAKVVLKKEQLETLEKRLQNAVTMLMLAQQSYLLALTRIQPQIIVQGFTEIATPLIMQTLQDNAQPGRIGGLVAHQAQLPSQDIESADDWEPKHRALPRQRSPKRQDAVSTIRFRLPTWLYRTTWELQSSASYGNWKFSLRYYRIVPNNSEVFYIAGCGEPKEIQMLFDSGRASPYDHDEKYGQPLLLFALGNLNIPMIKYLLDLGADPSEVSYTGRSTLRWIYPTDKQKQKNLQSSSWIYSNEFNKICDAVDIYVNYENNQCTCWTSLKSRAFFKVFQRIECPWHETTTLESRLQKLWSLGCMIVDPLAIPKFLQPYWSQDLRAVCIASMADWPLIHTIGEVLGFATTELELQDRDWGLEWTRLANMVISNTPNIHHLNRLPSYLLPRGKLTPLTGIVGVFIVWNTRKNYFSRLDSCFRQLWLPMVKSNGYDLEEYGRRENELLADKESNFSGLCKVSFWDTEESKGYTAGVVRLRGYEYGPEPKDWKVLWSLPEKSYSADFWRLVEDGPQLVPGAWVEDSDDDENEDWTKDWVDEDEDE